MTILFDQGVPAPSRRHLTGHDVKTSDKMGWSELRNGKLLAAAQEQFEAFITTDKRLRHEQNLSNRRLAILVLPTTSWPRIQQHVSVVVNAVNALKPGDFQEITFPD